MSIVKSVRHDQRLAEIMIGAPAGQPEFAEWATLLGDDSAASVGAIRAGESDTEKLVLLCLGDRFQRLHHFRPVRLQPAAPADILKGFFLDEDHDIGGIGETITASRRCRGGRPD